MAVKNIAVTDTLETFRTTFNELCADEFGDIANLSGSIVLHLLLVGQLKTQHQLNKLSVVVIF